MITQELKNQILAKEKYTAFELAKSGFIKNNKDNAHDYNFILKEIRRDRLRAVNMNPEGENPVYQITATAVIDYLSSFE